jgi:hypothetical protein
MGTILFKCPMTGRPVSTGIETEPISFCRLSKTWLDLYCPQCGRFHGAKIWLDQEMSASMSLSKSAAIQTAMRTGLGNLPAASSRRSVASENVLRLHTSASVGAPGVKVAGEKTAEWHKKGYDNVSTNVDCQWEPAKNYGL